MQIGWLKECYRGHEGAAIANLNEEEVDAMWSGWKEGAQNYSGGIRKK